MKKLIILKTLDQKLDENKDYNYSCKGGKHTITEEVELGKPKWQLADEQLKKELIAEMHAADQKLKSELLHEMHIADQKLKEELKQELKQEIRSEIKKAFSKAPDWFVTFEKKNDARWEKQEKFNELLLSLPTIKKEINELKNKKKV